VKFTCGGRVVIQTDRGLELGEQVSLTCTGCSKSISRDQMHGYVKDSGEQYLKLHRGKILREATPADLSEQRHLQEDARQKLAHCRKLVKEHGLPMKMVECEHLLGGERIIFYFMSEGRVDFRGLVRNLAQELHTRIEMRQIGARDEARLIADYETCGRECCCKTFLKTLKPVSMRMAKLQKATLDPSKVSGRCGRLKCCLRYEHDTYETLDKKLPKVGKRIRTSHGEGIVVSRQVLTQLVQIETDERQRVTVVIEDILEVGVPKPPPPPPVEPGARDRSRGRRPKPARPGSSARKPDVPAPQPKAEAEAPTEEVAEGESGESGEGAAKKRRRRRRRSRRGRSGPPGEGSGGDQPPAGGGDA
jgi:cell fate regulator YaaT (PSP1 superfamily)